MSEKLSRRAAIQTMAGAAALAGVSAFPDPLKAAPSSHLEGNIKHSVCKWCYPDMSVEELAAAAKKIGMQSVELLDPQDWPALSKHDLICAMANGPSTISDGWNRVENHEKLIPAFKDRIAAVANAGYPSVITFSGDRRGMDDEQGLENCALGLKQIMATAEKHNINVCMELLNSKVNHPDYMCDRTPWGVELVKRVGSERFKLLYDIYHMQIMEGDVIRTIRDNHQYFGHYHTGGNPGRNEIDETQELYYPAIMRAIKDTGFQGFVAQEFIPTRDPVTSLKEAVAICDV